MALIGICRKFLQLKFCHVFNRFFTFTYVANIFLQVMVRIEETVKVYGKNIAFRYDEMFFQSNFGHLVKNVFVSVSTIIWRDMSSAWGKKYDWFYDLKRWKTPPKQKIMTLLECSAQCILCCGTSTNIAFTIFFVFANFIL